jgi:FdhD protein
MSDHGMTKHFRALGRSAEAGEPRNLELIREEPILIRIEDRPYAVVMRTPGEESFHAAGFCFGEGIVDDPDDIEAIGYDDLANPNVVDVWLKPQRHSQIRERLERRFFVSQTSCGICGREVIQDLCRNLIPAAGGFEVGLEDVFACFAKLSQSQKHYQTTRGSHAALLFDEHFDELSFSEDVGRHNALDKAIGKIFLERTLPSARLVVLSSRISYELVQKAARARLPVMISGSRPTSLAVEMAQALNMTLAYPESESELTIVCGEDRIKG